MADKPFQTASIDTTTIFKTLIALPIGGEITYEELNALIGRDVQGAAHHNLESARHRALMEHRMVFGVIRGLGLRRFSDEEKVKAGENYLLKVRRTARRGARVVTSVDDFNALPNDIKVKHNTFASMFGAVAQATRAKQVLKLENRVREAQAQLPLAKTLAAFQE